MLLSPPCSKAGNLPTPIDVSDRETEPFQTDPAGARTVRDFSRQRVCALREQPKAYVAIGLVQA